LTGKIEIIAKEDRIETRTFIEHVTRTDKAAVVISVFNALSIDLENPFDVAELLVRCRELKRLARSERYSLNAELAPFLQDQQDQKEGPP
jgi:hypothetical protein